MKNFKLLVLSLIALSTMLISCSKDEDLAPAGTHKVLFVAETSSDAKISSVSYTNVTGDITYKSSVDAAVFNSGELTLASNVQAVSFTVLGEGSNSSTIKMQIYVDGKLAQENQSSGSVLAINTNYVITK